MNEKDLVDHLIEAHKAPNDIALWKVGLEELHEILHRDYKHHVPHDHEDEDASSII